MHTEHKTYVTFIAVVGRAPLRFPPAIYDSVQLDNTLTTPTNTYYSGYIFSASNCCVVSLCMLVLG
jgi:hypothetical protein